MHVLQGVSQSMSRVAGSGASEDFHRVGAELSQLKGKVREAIQVATAEEITGIIGKLENQENLSFEEKNLVGLWLVGDAEGYTKMEDDFGEWQEEFRRLSRVLETFRDREPSPRNLVEVHGVLEDAVRVAADLANFLEKKERVERFQTAINNVTPEDAKFLASMLRAKLSSEEM
jgi:hypothetical protein